MEKIRLKVSKQEIDDRILLSGFLEEYFNNFYSEMSVFGEYFSVQEYTNRVKFVDFISKKINDMDRLILVIRAFYYYEDFLTEARIVNDFNIFHQNIVEVADFLANVFENMKTSFIPPPDINFSLQSSLYPDYTLSETAFSRDDSFDPTGDDTGQIREVDYREIQTLIKIYLIREDISSKTFVCSLENDILKITSLNLEFHMRLYGLVSSPIWKLHDVKAGSLQSKQYLMASFGTPDAHLVCKICKFIEFYENRRRALEVFSMLEDPTGYFQNFSGLINGTKVVGILSPTGRFKLARMDNSGTSEIDSVDSLLLQPEPKKLMKSFIETSPSLFINQGHSFSFNTEDVFWGFSKNGDTVYVGKNPNFRNRFVLKFAVAEDMLQIANFEQNIDSTHDLTSHILEKFVEFNSHLLRLFYEIIRYNIPATLAAAEDDARRYFIVTKLVKVYFDKKYFVESYPLNILNQNHLFKSSNLESAINRVLLIHLQNIIQNVKINNNVEGEILSFEWNDIVHVTITDRVVTNLDLLTEDIRNFTLIEALNFIRYFAIFYKNNNIPSTRSRHAICFDFTDTLSENCMVSFEPKPFSLEGIFVEKPQCSNNGCITISGHKTLENIRYSNNEINHEEFHRLYLRNRFYCIKKFVLKKLCGNGHSSEVDLGDGQRVALTQNNIEYFSFMDDAFNRNVSNKLVTCRNFRCFLKRTVNELKDYLKP